MKFLKRNVILALGWQNGRLFIFNSAERANLASRRENKMEDLFAT